TLSRAAHLLAPTEPAHARLDILYSRVMHDPDWAAQARSLAHARTLPGLVNRWPLPDLPDPALRRILTGHTDWVRAVAIAPEGSWVAGGGDGSVRAWDAASGAERARLTGHTGRVQAVAIAPDGTWLASGGADGSVRVWDAVSGAERARLTGHTDAVWAVAIA